MSLSRYNSDFFSDPFLMRPFGGGSASFSPATDIRETDKGIHIVANVPAFNKEDIKIDLDESGNYLTITGKHSAENKDDGATYHRRERQMSSFTRSFRVPPGCDTSKIKAKLNNGALAIDIPKHAQASTPKRSITIE